MICESCGMPMETAEDHGGGDISSKYCKHCAPGGNLMSREEIRECWIRYTLEAEDISKEEAKRKVEAEMAKMPAWK